MPRPVLLVLAVAAAAALSLVAYIYASLSGRSELPVHIGADTKIEGDRTISRGETTVLSNGAKLTVLGRLEVSGALECADGELFVEVHGDLVVNGKLACNVGEAPPGTGISIVARGNVTFSPEAQVETDGSVQVVDSVEQLARTDADLDATFR